eukprot:CAMPEP_0175447574 /NCGR_PEP_ID=MMETSP0095-20121207/60880_1 /TAXON_ID=311494 /ORGANISM="Alexandrium monilatum, Strain CCMP3105" /LENGTH=39 /DNA_ID= /DNA_START= /DNA_END= /DNA_ORIENTATION=
MPLQSVAGNASQESTQSVHHAKLSSKPAQDYKWAHTDQR